MRSISALLAISIVSSQAFGADWDSIFHDAKSFGKQTAESQQTVVRNPKPQDVPFYTDKPPHAGAWGVTDFVGPATKHIAECSAGKGTTPQDRKECEAVVFLAKEAQNRPNIEVRPDDPLISGAKDIIDKATGGNTGGECVLKPGGSVVNKVEWCQAGAELGVKACGRVLELDVKAGCTAGEVFPVLDIRRNSCDVVRIFSKCEVGQEMRPDVQLTADAFGCKGGQNRNQTISVPKDIAAIDDWQPLINGWKGKFIVTARPHWENSYRDVNVYVLDSSKGCKPGEAECTFTFAAIWDSRWNGVGTTSSVQGELKITDRWVSNCPI